VPPRLGRRLGDLMAILAMTVLTALLVKTFILDASYIPSRSMMDVLQPGDFVLVNKFLYGARTPPALSGDYGPLPTFDFPRCAIPGEGTFCCSCSLRARARGVSARRCSS
jgi:signal peptidase I